jgi:L-asparaginase II
VLLAEVVRSGVVESRHRGSLVVLGVDGRPQLELGDPQRPMFPRSANKPLQAAIMLSLGLDLAPDLLAVACSSHAGLPRHVAAVRAILQGAGLTESDLANTPALPQDSEAAQALLIAGLGADRIHQNCSGNHAAMVATCVVAGWSTSGYLDPAHPLQVAIRAGYQAMAGTPMGPAAIDGCGAPLYETSLIGLARSYQRMITGLDAGARVAAAMRSHPDLVDGPGRSAAELIRAVPGLIAKNGAEGVFVVALPDGRVLALKIEDGAARACLPVVLAALRRLGVDSPTLRALRELEGSPVFGHGEVVGEVRAAAALTAVQPF